MVNTWKPHAIQLVEAMEGMYCARTQITFRNARITYQRVWPSFSYVSKFS